MRPEASGSSALRCKSVQRCRAGIRSMVMRVCFRKAGSGLRMPAMGREATFDLKTCLPDSGHTGQPRGQPPTATADALASDGVATLRRRRIAMSHAWWSLPSPVFDRFLVLWNGNGADRAESAPNCAVLGMPTARKPRMNARSEHSPVTPIFVRRGNGSRDYRSRTLRQAVTFRDVVEGAARRFLRNFPVEGGRP
jgi:hypothetical protein